MYIQRVLVTSVPRARRSCIRNFQRLPSKNHEKAERRVPHPSFCPPIFLVHLPVPVGTVSTSPVTEKSTAPASFPRYVTVSQEDRRSGIDTGRTALEYYEITNEFGRFSVLPRFVPKLAADVRQTFNRPRPTVWLYDPVIGNRAVCSRYCQQQKRENAEKVRGFWVRSISSAPASSRVPVISQPVEETRSRTLNLLVWPETFFFFFFLIDGYVSWLYFKSARKFINLTCSFRLFKHVLEKCTI